MNLKSEFTRIATQTIHRNGLTDLLAWLESTDFYTAPASTRFHGAYETGLVMHSLNVYSNLKRICNWYGFDYSDESLAIVALFHDFCKINCYKTEMRWRKDSNDKWEQYPVYTFKEDFAYGGHGSKSVFLVQTFMQLSADEASAINCHMGAWDLSTYNNPSEVYRRNHLAWALHVADEAADYLGEEENE